MDYNKQAIDFLKSCNVEILIEKAVPQTAPLWAQDGKHGTKWSIELAKIKGNSIDKKIQFFFWSSIKSKEEAQHSYHGEKKPSAYDVLSCLDASEVGTFEDFCANFGYDEDSRKAFETYQEVLELNKKLETIFTPDELEKLIEIQ